MEHKYIDFSILRDFPKTITLDDVSDDFDRYKITNIMDETQADYEEYRYYLEEALYDDYTNQRANYMSYIEPGMDARFMMELRKSAILPITDEKLIGFYGKHAQCKSIEEIKGLRVEYLKFLNDDYQDLDWQLYMLLRYCWKNRGSDIVIDYECCFKDGDYTRMRNPIHYRADFLAQHLPPERLKWMV